VGEQKLCVLLNLPVDALEDGTMAESSGGVGVLGVLVGALIVIVVGGGVLFATGNLGQKSSTVKVELPKIGTSK
jgi:hypothetical protein